VFLCLVRESYPQSNLAMMAARARSNLVVWADHFVYLFDWVRIFPPFHLQNVTSYRRLAFSILWEVLNVSFRMSWHKITFLLGTSTPAFKSGKTMEPSTIYHMANICFGMYSSTRFSAINIKRPKNSANAHSRSTWCATQAFSYARSASAPSQSRVSQM